MGKTTHKYLRMGICTGRNTQWYRDRRRNWRRSINHQLRNVIANNAIDDASDMIGRDVDIPKKDSWMEPTDGTVLIYDNKVCSTFWSQDYINYLKPRDLKTLRNRKRPHR